MDNLMMALLTFFSVAHLTCILTFKGYPKGVDFPFQYLNISICFIIVCIGISESYGKEDALKIFLDTTWVYSVYLIVVIGFCYTLDYTIRKNN